MSHGVRPPTAYVDQDEYGCFTVFPTSLVVDLRLGHTIRFSNLTTHRVRVDLPPRLSRYGALTLRPGREGSATVRRHRATRSYTYRVRVDGFEARGGSGPKVIVDP